MDFNGGKLAISERTVTELPFEFEKVLNYLHDSCTHIEPASPGPDSDTTMDTMEVDSSDLDGSRGLDDPEEPSTPDENMFDTDSPFLDREKDEEPIKTIRYEDVWPVSVLTLRLLAFCW